MPMELHGGADIHVQFMEDPMPEQGDGPKGGCDPVESAPPPPPERPIRDIGGQPGNGPILRRRNRNCDWRLHVSVTLQIFSIKEAVLPHHMRTPPRLLRTNEDRRHTAGMVTKEVPYTATELAKLKNEYSRNPTESETEYVWRVSLTGGDQILLSEREAEGYWAPGVFLTPGDHRAPWSLTQQAAYWAGGLNPLERGDPLALTGSVDQLVENVQKAACLQMMHDGELKFRQESPVMVPVDPERMTPLVRGLPDSLKPLGIQLQSTIRNTPQSARVTAALTRAVTPDRCTLGQKVWMWGEFAQELINYGRKYGPVNTSLVRSESKGLRRTEIKSPGSSTRLPPPRSPSGRNIPNRRNTSWSLGQQKGVPRDLMDGLPTGRLEELFSGWPESLATKTGSNCILCKQLMKEKRIFVTIGRIIIIVKTLPLYRQFLVCHQNKELLNFLVMVNIEA
ncbi:uncharacterized protein [Nyctibius grandis]|uniref:uncharacterized protein n=1 Tax=Nyctibius grandis TaxID=48427 RepID=UPI0035BC7205